jgi:hypothetical protein
MNKYVDASALGQVLLASVIGGVGLVALFALGLRGLAAAQENGRPAGYLVAGGSFAIVLTGIVLGLYTLLAA